MVNSQQTVSATWPSPSRSFSRDCQAPYILTRGADWSLNNPQAACSLPNTGSSSRRTSFEITDIVVRKFCVGPAAAGCACSLSDCYVGAPACIELIRFVPGRSSRLRKLRRLDSQRLRYMTGSPTSTRTTVAGRIRRSLCRDNDLVLVEIEARFTAIGENDAACLEGLLNSTAG